MIKLIVSLLFFFCLTPLYANQSLPEDFEHFNLENECRGCGLTGETFSKETLRNMRHVNAALGYAYLIDTHWVGVNLQSAAMHDVTGWNMHFERCEMRHANLSYSDLPYMQMDATNHLESVDFTGSGLEYSHFSGVTLDRAFFNKSVLVEVDFSNAKITNTDFSGAGINDADFTDAVVKDCNFTDSEVVGVNFTRADLRGSIISAQQLATAKTLCGAILPDGTRGGC